MSEELFRPLIIFFESLAYVMPLEVYVFVGSFVEEVIAPIPQSLIVVVAGTLANAQNYSLFALVGLVVLSALGKTLASWFLYIVGDKGEHLLVGKFGKMLGITEQEITKWSKRFTNGWKDILLVFFSRFIPVLPTAPVSIVCGVIKMKLKSFLLVTFLGLLFRDAFFIGLGYVGVSSYEALSGKLGGAESAGKVVVFLSLLGFFSWIGYKATKRHMKKIEFRRKQ